MPDCVSRSPEGGKPSHIETDFIFENFQVGAAITTYLTIVVNFEPI